MTAPITFGSLLRPQRPELFPGFGRPTGPVDGVPQIRTTVAHDVQYAPLVDGKPDMSKVHVVDEVNLGHAAYTAKTVIATPKGANGKVTGWNLTPGTSTPVTSTIDYMRIYTAIPGETFVGYVDPNTALTSHTTTGGLMVSNLDKVVALPNTPVDLAPVA